jgi:hypothetical protein
MPTLLSAPDSRPCMIIHDAWRMQALSTWVSFLLIYPRLDIFSDIPSYRIKPQRKPMASRKRRKLSAVGFAVKSQP